MDKWDCSANILENVDIARFISIFSQRISVINVTLCYIYCWQIWVRKKHCKSWVREKSGKMKTYQECSLSIMSIWTICISNVGINLSFTVLPPKYIDQFYVKIALIQAWFKGALTQRRMWNFVLVKIFDFLKSKFFLKILTGTKLYARTHFDRKNFFFIKLW